MPSNKDIGLSGENSACKFLISQGYQIIERNYRSKTGEIDIIAIDNNILVFIEVKSRTSLSFGIPESALNRRKISKIAKTGLLFKAFHPELPEGLRIDAVCFDQTGIRLIKNISQM